MPYKDKDKQRERQRAYAQKPEVRERQRAYMRDYFAKPEVRERQRAYRSDLSVVMRRCELDADGIEAIVAAICEGHRYIDIATDWLIEEGYVCVIASAHGIRRRARRAIADQQEQCP